MVTNKKFKKVKSKNFKKKRRSPTPTQKAAYWIGVGLSAGRDSNLKSALLESSPLKKNFQAGYNADNYRDVGGSFKTKR